MKDIRKKILFLAPVFMGYEKKIIENLKNDYEISFVDNEQLYPKFQEAWNKSKIRKIERRLIPNLREKDWIKMEESFVESYEELIDCKNDVYDIVFCIKGDLLPNEFYKRLKTHNPNARYILYEYDDISKLEKQNFFEYFDELYSYNIDDCEKYGFKYLPMFVGDKKETHSDMKEIDVCFISSNNDKNRLKTIKKIYEYNKNKFNFFIYIYSKTRINFFDYDIPLDFEKYCEIVAKSKAIVEIPVTGQTGPTTRCLDSVFSKTKVITTNKNIKKYPFYIEDNYFCLEDDYKIPHDFLDSSYIDMGIVPLDCDNWCKEISL